MTIRRAAAAMLAVIAAAVPGRTFAQPDAFQVIAAARISAVAQFGARSAVDDVQRALAPAFLIVDQTVPRGLVEIQSGHAQVNPTYVSVPVVITVDGRIARTVYAGYRITTFIAAICAAHDLAPDAVLGADDLGVARVPFSGRAALDKAAFVGRKVRAAIARGALLYPEQTVVNEIVLAGMPAVLIVHDGPVSLAADVVARTSGGLGEFVTIFNPQTQKALSGIVTAPNTVELTLPGAN